MLCVKWSVQLQKGNGVYFVKNRSTVYCYPFPCAGYTCGFQRLNHNSLFKMKLHYKMMFFVHLVGQYFILNLFIYKTGFWLISIFNCSFDKYWELFTGLADCCSVENVKNVVKNAIVSCPDNSWCKATCYRDFIFPSGVIEMSSYCEDGVWTPLLSSCKSELFPIMSPINFKILLPCLHYFATVTVLNIYQRWVEK